MLPKDPEMLLSMINMKLRDSGLSLDELCDELDADRSEIEDILKRAGHIYIEEKNWFK